MSKIQHSVIKVTIYWTLAVLFVGMISGIVADSSASDGEQKLFSHTAVSIAVALVGIILINLAMLLFYRRMDVGTRIFSVGITIAATIILFPLFIGVVDSQYEEDTEYREVGTDKIEIKTEYYNSNDTSEIIRSKRFWKNGKKDSIWTTYDRTGSIIEQLIFKEGQLIKSVK